MTRSFSSRTAPILPLVLLTVSLLEEILWYVLRREVASVALRVVIRLVLVGAAFSVAAEVIEPWLRTFFGAARSATRRGVGRRFGPASFYLVAYGLLFAAYYVAETRGVRAFVP